MAHDADTPREPSRPRRSDAAAVEAVVRAYIDSWHRGDAHQMAGALGDDLVKRGVTTDPGGLRQVTKDQMVQLTQDGGGRSPDAGSDVVVHHVEADVASAHVATADFLDYLHLARTDGTWRIVHDLFRERS